MEYQGKVIGSLGIEEYSEAHYPELSNISGREIGYVLSRDYWGRGLMPEAVKVVIKYLFETVKLDFILVGHFDWNRQSARVIEKCGFRYIKTRPYETQYGTAETSEESILYRDYTCEKPEHLVCGRKSEIVNGQQRAGTVNIHRKTETAATSILHGGGKLQQFCYAKYKMCHTLPYFVVRIAHEVLCPRKCVRSYSV